MNSPQTPRFFDARCLQQGVLSLLLLISLAACSPKALVMSSLADELAAQSQGAENDPELARDAAPFYLKLSESVLARQPTHAALAESVAGRMTEYAYAFVAFEADRIEARDAQTAAQLRQRAAALYQRAQRHALRALEARHPGLMLALAKPDTTFALSTQDAGLAYWAAAAWGSGIALSKDQPEIVADLPLAVRLAELAQRAAPDWGDGAMDSLRATFEASRPGGDKQQAERWFDAAISKGKGRLAGPYVAKAEALALPAGNRAAFEKGLQQALTVSISSDSPFALQNAVMRRRAQWLLEQAPDLF